MGYRFVRRPLLLAISLVYSTVTAADTLSLSWDNDLLTGTDKGYTNGINISLVTTPAEHQQQCGLCLARRARNHLAILPGIGAGNSQHALAYSIRQLMITPENIKASTPQFNDIPYTGYLSARVGLWSWTPNRITGYSLMFGVVGPNSYAEQSQEQVHRITGSTDPNGWHNQLGTDGIGGMEVTHARRFYSADSPDKLEQDMGWVASLRASNFISDARLGLTWRTGRNLPPNFVPDYAGISSTIGLPGVLDGTGSGWSLFAGAMAEWIPYSYIDRQADRYAYNQRALVGHAGIGAGWHTSGFQATLSLRTTTAQDKTNKDPLSFGTLSFTWQL